MKHPLTEDDLSPDGPVEVQSWLGAPALSYPRHPPTVLDALDRAVGLFGDRPAMTEPAGGDRPECTVTWAQLADLVQGAADALTARGLKPGDTIAVAARNSLALAVTLLGSARAGVVMVGLNTRLAPAQWGYMLGHSQVQAAYAADDLADDLRAAGADRVDPITDLLTTSSTWRWSEADRPDTAAAYAVVYTSGTTGRPKASQVVHRASVHSGMSYQRVLGLTPDDRTLVLFPLYYISAMHAHVLPAMLSGACCVLTDASSPRELATLLAAQRITWAYAVPSLWMLAVRARGFDRDHLPDLRVLAAGGAPFPASLVTALRERLPGVRLIDVYGLTETHSPATMLLDDEFADHPGTVGRPLPCMQAQVRDDDAVVLAPGEAGELWLRGSLVTTGYAGDPVATSRAIVDGWFDTGDVARIDAGGFVTILDRSKDMINRGGTKIFSAEVEEILRKMDTIADAAVVGVPDPVAGESVVAFVVPAPTGGPTPAQVRAWVRDRMAEHAAPRQVHLVDELPRNPVGKTDKPTLREWAAELREGR